MKLVLVTYRFEYEDRIEAILDAAEVVNFIRIPMAQGGDADGRHFGTQVHPGHMSQVQALLDDSGAKTLLEQLRSFKQEKQAHEHLVAACVQVEDCA